MTHSRGAKLVAQFAGQEMEDRVRQMFADVAPDFIDHVVAFGFGEIYARPGLEPVERQIAAIAALTAIDNGWSLRNHIEIGLRVGMPPEQVVAVLMQTIPYVGFPKAAEALLLARRIFDEQGLLPVPAADPGD
ncbi:carboxymuconolactone decarboxylase family protein [Streptomyces coacervatus]|uniref:Carboxymuconolactone decarboxylase family protein n=1 Tax=Streptomyces coacervatus TaxID=647381 RepID=A0ABP7H4L5_9ACTN|nr:carboxymuconolactone decarboxylase family protein [Streptomyces coacervatus]MDF2267365.1 carboxymuconolactone decarboxylase family protein [Streptomyces coacervatus]